jgi:hypothetical protein
MRLVNASLFRVVRCFVKAFWVSMSGRSLNALKSEFCRIEFSLFNGITIRYGVCVCCSNGNMPTFFGCDFVHLAVCVGNRCSRTRPSAQSTWSVTTIRLCSFGCYCDAILVRRCVNLVRDCAVHEGTITSTQGTSQGSGKLRWLTGRESNSNKARTPVSVSKQRNNAAEPATSSHPRKTHKTTKKSSSVGNRRHCTCCASTSLAYFPSLSPIKES